MNDTKVFICQRRRRDLSPAGKAQLNHFAHLTSEQKDKIKRFIFTQSWLKDVIQKHMHTAPAITRLEYFFVYLGLYVSHRKELISLQDFDQSNPCVRATVEFLQENIDWLKPMIDYYIPLLKNSLLERNFRKLMRQTDYESESVGDERNVDDFKEFLVQLTEIFLAENRKSETANGARPKRKQIKVPKEFWPDLVFAPKPEKYDCEYKNSIYVEPGNGFLNSTTKRVTRRDGYPPLDASRTGRHTRYHSKSPESMSPARYLTDKAFAKVFPYESDRRVPVPARPARENDYSVERLLKNVQERRQQRRSVGETIPPVRRLNSTYTPANEFKVSKLNPHLFAAGNEYSYSSDRSEDRENYPAINARRERPRPRAITPASTRRYLNSTKYLPTSKTRDLRWDFDALPTENESYSWDSRPHYEIRDDYAAENNLPRYKKAGKQWDHLSSPTESYPPMRRTSRRDTKPGIRFEAPKYESNYYFDDDVSYKAPLTDNAFKPSKLKSKYFEDEFEYINPMERRKTIGNIYTLNDARLDSSYRDDDNYY